MTTDLITIGPLTLVIRLTRRREERTMPQRADGTPYSELTIITDVEPEAADHPAWSAFEREMIGRAYGREALWSAWEWFKSGWEESSRP